jgi:hypothetical protein
MGPTDNMGGDKAQRVFLQFVLGQAGHDGQEPTRWNEKQAISPTHSTPALSGHAVCF